MKELLLVVLLLAAGYLGYELNNTRHRLATTTGQLEAAEAEIERLTPRTAGEKTWLQKKIQEGNSSLDAGAYNQARGVARSATLYYAPTNNVQVRTAATPQPTPQRNNNVQGRTTTP